MGRISDMGTDDHRLKEMAAMMLPELRVRAFKAAMGMDRHVSTTAVTVDEEQRQLKLDIRINLDPVDPQA